jgi:hypothetical protein
VNVRLFAVLASTLAACRSHASIGEWEAHADEPTARNSATGVAVVELFTSEGCSSCPPADAVLADLARRRPPVYALAFHVDYWDTLGWPDRFASSENTARQREYARSFGASGMYTPQMIVDGTDAFNGSDRSRADTSIALALARSAPVRLSVHARAVDADAVAVDYDVQGASAGSVLDLAVVERAASTDVRAGENAGRTLHHANVVRAFVVVPLVTPTGTATLHVTTGLKRDGAEVIAYVQREASERGDGRPVLGAARVALPQ